MDEMDSKNKKRRVSEEEEEGERKRQKMGEEEHKEEKMGEREEHKEEKTGEGEQKEEKMGEREEEEMGEEERKEEKTGEGERKRQRMDEEEGDRKRQKMGEEEGDRKRQKMGEGESKWQTMVDEMLNVELPEFNEVRAREDMLLAEVKTALQEKSDFPSAVSEPLTKEQKRALDRDRLNNMGDATDGGLPVALKHTSNCPEVASESIRLGILTDADVLADSIMEVTCQGLRGQHHSVTDPRLGPPYFGAGIQCLTCHGWECGGHVAHIDLHEWFYQPLHVEHCLRVFRQICFFCKGPAVLCENNRKMFEHNRKVRRSMWNKSHARKVERKGVGKFGLDQYSFKSEKESDENDMFDVVFKEDPDLCIDAQPKLTTVTVGRAVFIKLVNGAVLMPSVVKKIFDQTPNRTYNYLKMKNPSSKFFMRYLRVSRPGLRQGKVEQGSYTRHEATLLYNKIVGLVDTMYDKTRVIQALEKNLDTSNGEEDVELKDRLVTLHCVPSACRRGKPAAAAAKAASAEDSEKGEGEESSKEEKKSAESDNESMEDEEEGSIRSDEDEDAEPREPQELDGPVEPDGGYLVPMEDDGEGDNEGDDDEDGEGEEEEEEEGQAKKENADDDKDEEDWREVLGKNLKKKNEIFTQVSSLVCQVTESECARLVGKSGLFRQNLLGKRVNRCGRGVFTGDNTLPMGTVGIPKQLASQLYRNELVTHWNKAVLQNMVDRFPAYPCAHTVVRGQREVNIGMVHRSEDPFFTLNVGDMVERQLVDGDEVLVNRQPTLAKNNIITHRVKITHLKTISLNIMATDNYAADCDGDEMNIFVPSQPSFKAEVLSIESNLVFNKNCKISTKLKQDSLRGAYSLSLSDVFLRREECEWIMPPGCLLPPPAILKPETLWTGKQMLSLCLPENLSTVSRNKAVELDEKIIRQGQIVSGVFDKGFQDELLVCTKTQTTSQALIKTMERMQCAADNFIAVFGYPGTTFLSSDWVGPNAQEYKRHVKELVSEINQLEKDLVEKNVYFAQVLGVCAAPLVESLPRDSNIKALFKAGSKKKPEKLVQGSVVIGQQNLRDKMLEKQLDGYRIHPAFDWDDKNPEAHGFVSFSYAEGFSSTHTGILAQVARYAQFQKHCATEVSGYLQRRLGKMMEDLTVRHDLSVRDGNNEIVQTIFGDDGFAPDRCVPVTLLASVTDEEDDRWVEFVLEHCLNQSEIVMALKEFIGITRDRQALSRMLQGATEKEVTLPCNIYYLITKVQDQVPSDGPKLKTKTIVRKVSRLFDYFDSVVRSQVKMQDKPDSADKNSSKKVVPRSPQRGVDGRYPMYNTDRRARRKGPENVMGDPYFVFKCYVKQYLNSYTMIVQEKLTRNQFVALVREIKSLFKFGRVSPGECVGAQAAQALAEPLMQITLNSVHRMCVSSDADVMPRLKALLNGTASDLAYSEILEGLPRSFLADQIGQLYENADEKVDRRHVSLVADFMTKDGVVKGYTRHCMSDLTSHLKSAAFEQPTAVLRQAAAREDVDALKGVSENIIMTKGVNVGHKVSGRVGGLYCTEEELSPARKRKQPDDEPMEEELDGGTKKKKRLSPSEKRKRSEDDCAEEEEPDGETKKKRRLSPSEKRKRSDDCTAEEPEGGTEKKRVRISEEAVVEDSEEEEDWVDRIDERELRNVNPNLISRELRLIQKYEASKAYRRRHRLIN